MASTVKSPETLYTGTFHTGRDANTRATARHLLSLIREWTGAESIADIGCGVGSWLAAAGESGYGTVQGFEGPWGQSANLVVDPAAIRFQDLEQPIRAERRYDLAISLEVAEHLSAARAPLFVADLCALSDLVMFSAAIPHQGGVGHVSERWQSWWAGHFAALGYTAFDPIRPLIWNDPEVAFWYRQNILIYAREGSAQAAALAAKGFAAAQSLDLVHPEQYAFHLDIPLHRTITRKLKRMFAKT